MARIDKLRIQGIRSFGPDERDKQVIQFFTPLTLILGPNGSGKTTVIECLRYMTTGDLPPGCMRGSAFIHDPKVAHEPEVKAQVRLQFHDLRGEECVAQRSLIATQKAKKTEMKTLEGVITRRRADGEKYSISSKCAEMDYEMVSLLGVSKPILENVIFCHQEDSTWPLSEGKALKQKFDDIFASTRYVKALDVIRKCRQDHITISREYQTEIKYLRQNKEKASLIRADLESAEVKYMASRDSVAKIVQELQPIEERLQQIASRSGDIQKLYTKLETTKAQKAAVEKAIQELRSNIQNVFQGDRHELELERDEFLNKVKLEEDRVKKLKESLLEMDYELDRMGKDRSNLLIEQGKLDLEAKNNRDNIKQRDIMVQRLAQQHQLPGLLDSVSNESVVEFLHSLGEKMKHVLSLANERKANTEKTEEALQADVDKFKKQLTTVEVELSSWRQNLSKNKEEIRTILRALADAETDAERLGEIEEELRRREKELTDIEKSVDVNLLKVEIEQIVRQRLELDANLRKLDSEMNRLSLESSIRSQLEMLRKDKASKESQMQRLRAKNEDSFCHLLGSIPQENLSNSVDECRSKLQESLHRLQREQERAKTRLAELESDRRNTMELLKKGEEEYKVYEEKTFAICESQDLDDSISKINEKLKSAQDTKGFMQGSEIVLKKYKSDLEKEDPPCPLCHRPFDDRNEVTELIDELNKKLNLVPQKVTQVTEQLDRYKGKYEQMLQLCPIRDQMVRFVREDLPDLKKKINEFSSQIEILQRDISEREENIAVLESDKITAESIGSDAMMMDRYAREIKSVGQQIDVQAAKLFQDSGRTLQAVTEEKNDTKAKLDVLSTQLEQKRDKVTHHGERVQQIRSKVHEQQAAKLHIQQQLQETSRLKENKLSLQRDADDLAIKIRGAEEEIQPLQAKIQSAIAKRDESIRLKNKQYEQDKDLYNKIREERQSVEELQNKINKYQKDGHDKNLDSIKQRIGLLERRTNDLSKHKDDLQTQINAIMKELSNQKIRERELNDSLALCQKEDELAALSKQVESMRRDLGGLDATNLENDRQRLQKQEEKLRSTKYQAEGRQRGYEDEMKKLKKELNEDMYKDAEEKYRDKVIMLRTAELASGDLDKYYKALDKTILTYHRQKMDEINKIIQELWRNTYRGNDIETIEIQSDEDGGGGAAKTRRTYNYRVVMKKGDTELDMRGRCSAGQKMLASIIIRLALSETFCLNCGILALDEPTTNLDRENIESLAYALVEIIKGRAKQNNFQLVVITHDEDFVELLGRSQFVEAFYKVRKSDRQYSTICKARVEELHVK